jgi:Asp-tRNA(Asn)/Glu-tRNA(Gln) amidotransferase A subunit family amidase
VRRVVDLGASVGDEEYRALLADRRRVEAAAARTFERVDVLVLPLDPYLPRRLDTPRPDSVVPAGASAQGETSVGFLELAALPRLPALSLPAGHARDGAPLAVQLLARRGGEPALVAAATRLEAVLGVANPAVAAAGA